MRLPSSLVRRRIHFVLAVSLGSSAGLFAVASCGIDLVGSESDPRPDTFVPDSRGEASLPPTNDDDAATDGPSDAGTDTNKPTGIPETLVTLTTDGGTVRAIAINSTNLFWADNSRSAIVKADLNGMNPSDLIVGVETRQIAVDNSFLWRTFPGLSRYAITGGSETLLAQDIHGCVFIDRSEGVYATDFGTQRVIFSPYAGGTPTTLFSADAGQGIDRPWGVAVNATDIFVTDVAQALILKAPRNGTVLSKLIADQQSPQCLSFDEIGRLYWADYARGEIRRANADGTGEVVLATDQVEPTQVAVNAQYIYWNSANKVMRLTRSSTE